MGCRSWVPQRSHRVVDVAVGWRGALFQTMLFGDASKTPPLLSGPPVVGMPILVLFGVPPLTRCACGPTRQHQRRRLTSMVCDQAVVCAYKLRRPWCLDVNSTSRRIAQPLGSFRFKRCTSIRYLPLLAPPLLLLLLLFLLLVPSFYSRLLLLPPPPSLELTPYPRRRNRVTPPTRAVSATSFFPV